jgi:hypothetical protein
LSFESSIARCTHLAFSITLVTNGAFGAFDAALAIRAAFISSLTCRIGVVIGTIFDLCAVGPEATLEIDFTQIATCLTRDVVNKAAAFETFVAGHLTDRQIPIHHGRVPIVLRITNGRFPTPFLAVLGFMGHVTREEPSTLAATTTAR